jgi:hypothetical protein
MQGEEFVAFELFLADPSRSRVIIVEKLTVVCSHQLRTTWFANLTPT